MPQTTTIGFEQLSKYFHLPINDVAKELGICATMLKKICRRNQIPRWPHRKIKSLNKMIENLENSLQNNPSEAEECIKQEISILKNKKTLIMKNPSILASNAQKRTLLMGGSTGGASDDQHGKPVKKIIKSEEISIINSNNSNNSNSNSNSISNNSNNSNNSHNSHNSQHNNNSSHNNNQEMIKLTFSQQHQSNNLQLPLPTHQQQQQQQSSIPQQTNFSINHLLTPANSYPAPLTSFLLEDEEQINQSPQHHHHQEQNQQQQQSQQQQQQTTTYITTSTPHSISYQHQNPTINTIQRSDGPNDISQSAWYQTQMNSYLTSTPMYSTQVVTTAHPEYYTLPKLNLVEAGTNLGNAVNQQIIQSPQGQYITTSQLPPQYHTHHQLPHPHQAMSQNQQQNSKVIYMKSSPSPTQYNIIQPQTIISTPAPPNNLRWMVDHSDKLNISRKM